MPASPDGPPRRAAERHDETGFGEGVPDESEQPAASEPGDDEDEPADDGWEPV